ncbi:4269_t:CDS:2, partial [Cetraspora pellucida]
MLESNEKCAKQLQKLNDKSVLFNAFWNIKLYFEVMLAAIWLKKGYYIQYMKEGLWSIFDLYNTSNLDNPNSDTFLLLIIKGAGDTVLQKGFVSSSAISKAAIQENYKELSSGDDNENDY